MSKGFIIAIDGPVASGKGTTAVNLAKDIDGFYLYTGAMYRCIALLCIEKKIDFFDKKGVESTLSEFDIDLAGNKIFLKGQDVTERITKQDVASGASEVGAMKMVRDVAVAKQREIASSALKRGKVVVSEGRDTGTNVFPNAEVKIYLTAKPEVRARRRMEQYLKEDKDFKKELRELVVRDEKDTMREINPLPVNPEDLGYYILDSSDMNEKETLDAIKKELKRRKLI